MDHLVFEAGIALVLMAIAGLISARFRFSIVPLLILAGMLVGPHAPHIGILDFRFLHTAPLIEFMGRLGVLFLLFYLGLEFSVGRLMSAGRSIVVGGSIYIAINFTLGLGFAFLQGWELKEILVSAGITTISSSAIVAKVLVDLKRTANSESEMVLGITLFEDIFLALYLSIVSGLVLSQAADAGSVIGSAGVALGFMIGLLVVGRLAQPLINRLNIPSDEVFLLVVFSALMVIAGFAETLHVAEAIGALLFGMVLAETDHAKRIEHLVIPFRDFFGAVFFFSFGLSIDPLTLGGAAGLAIGAVILTLIGNYVAGSLAGRTAGLSSRASLNIGLTLMARGEFAIILANLAQSGGLLPILQPFTALYVLLMAILGPVMAKESKTIHNFLSRLTGKAPAAPTRTVEMPRVILEEVPQPETQTTEH